MKVTHTNHNKPQQMNTLEICKIELSFHINSQLTDWKELC